MQAEGKGASQREGMWEKNAVRWHRPMKLHGAKTQDNANSV
jgi:hypothetical protein